MAKLTSRVFSTWDALYTLLDTQPWTAHPSTGVIPKVWYGDIDEPKTEAIIVASVPAANPEIDWATFGQNSSQDEDFAFRIIIGTKVDGCTATIVRARLGVLCDVVQTALRSPSTGRPAGGFDTTVPGVLWWRVTRPSPQIYSLPDLSGYGGYAELDVMFRARI